MKKNRSVDCSGCGKWQCGKASADEDRPLRKIKVLCVRYSSRTRTYKYVPVGVYRYERYEPSIAKIQGSKGATD